MTNTVACPECGQAATVLDRSSLYSTDGPIEHLRIRCIDRHHFLLPANRVDEYASAEDLPAAS